MRGVLFSLMLICFSTALQAETVGYKDLTIGSPPSVISENCKVVANLSEEFRCHGADDIKFVFFVDDESLGYHKKVFVKD